MQLLAVDSGMLIRAQSTMGCELWTTVTQSDGKFLGQISTGP